MARRKKEQARGLRGRVAETVATRSRKNRSSSSKVPKPVQAVMDLASQVEDRVTGKSASRKKAAAKAARTRKRNAAKRSAAAKKGARTRAKARG